MTTSNASEIFGIAGGKLCVQEFNSSGTFTPSAALLARGGVVLVRLIGGGASGCASYGSSLIPPSGHAGRDVEGFVVVTGPVSVTIGAGGTAVVRTATAGVSPGLAGGDSTFGALLTAKGGAAPVAVSTAYSGDGSKTTAQPWYDGTAVQSRPGVGADGRGGGGSSNASYPAADGGGNGVYGSSSPVTGGSATPNTGGGGGGAGSGGGYTATSGAGAKGWIRVIWVE